MLEFRARIVAEAIPVTNHFILTPFVLDQHSSELEILAQSSWTINRPNLPEGSLQQRLSELHRPLVDLVAQAVARGQRPVSIAGDCCTAIGVLAGLQRAGQDPTLIWLDAHGDFNTWETTPSGFLGGMPLAMVVGRGEQTLVNAMGLRPLPEAHVILTDGRDLDPGERQALAGSAVRHYSVPHALLMQPLADRPMYIHFDTDIINPDDAPAMTYRTPSGPSAAELEALFRSLALAGHIVAISMATWNPQRDQDGHSQTVCMALLQALLD